MTKRQPGLSLQDHEELGRRLAAMRDELVDIAMLVSIYKLKSGAYKYASRARDDIDRLRSIMDDFVYLEHREELLRSGKSPERIYYPLREARQHD